MSTSPMHSALARTTDAPFSAAAADSLSVSIVPSHEHRMTRSILPIRLARLPVNSVARFILVTCFDNGKQAAFSHDMTDTNQIDKKRLVLPLGVVLRRSPGVTRWAKWAWKAVAVIPGAGPAGWRVLRGEDGVTEFHAATVPLELHSTEVGSYRTSLMMTPPAVFV